MHVIDSYLDTLFAPYPRTARLDAAREELRQMMEDQYDDLRSQGLSESQAVGRVIGDFGSLEDVATTLGISPDLVAAQPGSTAPDEASSGALPAQADTHPGGQSHLASPPLVTVDRRPELDVDRARDYVAAVTAAQPLTALSTALLVLCPVPLLLLMASATSSDRGVSADTAALLGVLGVLLIVALGVGIGMHRDRRVADFPDILEGRRRPSPETQGYAQSILDTHPGAGPLPVVLYVLSAVPVLTAAFSGSDPLVLGGAALTLALVALGLFLSIRANGQRRAAGDLLDLEHSRELAEANTPAWLRTVLAAWWPLIVAVFLLVGLGLDAFDRAWVVFPVGGVLYWGLLEAAESFASRGATQK
ncbi:hypothetical protein JSY14_09475 [Brachybacterium sp. EF45031]|uniref:permease prefix domain 1-containing protein n=1 Tax=Brachybacterium sillae TaxID=2810536 RepID=UPI00217E0CED|nr:permease prefix domain 1-containing protein [Brachybacterium sillae]MCS6712235.1 hypothetical protein [Brachybacterium sillae]